MSGDKIDPTRWLEAHGDAMFRFARLRLWSEADAEDAVQEALLAALQAAPNFRADSAERTWLLGICRHKVLDLARRRSREQAWRRHVADATGDEFREQRGRPMFPSDPWPTGEMSDLERGELRRILARAVATLPHAMRQAFCLREIDGLSTDEICELLDVSKTNLWTLIHRAKVRLREELDQRWFEDRREES